MFFCCPLVAIFSTVYSVAAVNAMGRGDSALAASKASVAKICVIVVSVLWALLIAAYLYMLKTGRIPAE